MLYITRISLSLPLSIPVTTASAQEASFHFLAHHRVWCPPLVKLPLSWSGLWCGRLVHLLWALKPWAAGLSRRQMALLNQVGDLTCNNFMSGSASYPQWKYFSSLQETGQVIKPWEAMIKLSKDPQSGTVITADFPTISYPRWNCVIVKQHKV